MTLKKTYIIYLLLFSIIVSCKKETEIHTNKETTLSNEEKVLVDSIRNNLYTKPEKAIPFINSFLELSKKNNEKDKVMMAYGSLGIAYDIMDNVDQCLYYYYKVLSLCESSECELTAKYDIGKIFEKRYNYEQALILYEECYALVKKEKLVKDYDKIERALAFINNKIGLSDKAIKILEKKYNKVKEENNLKSIRITRRDLIEVYISNKKLDHVFNLIDIGLKDAKASKNEELQYYLYKFKSEAHIQKEDYNQAIEAINEAVTIANSLGADRFIIESNYLLALINKNKNRPENTIKILEKVLQKKYTTPEVISKSYKLLAESYNAINNAEMSSHYYKKHSEEEQKIKNKGISILNKTHDLSLKELTSEKNKQEQRKWYWSVISIILLLVLLTVFIRNKKVKSKNKILFNNLMLKIKALEEHKTKIEVNQSSTLNTITNEPSIAIEEEKDESTYIIDNEKVKEIITKLEKLEKQNYFLRQDCTLHNMAKRLKTNTSYLSKIVNTTYNKSFSVYINELRINYVLLELKNNKQLRSYSVKAISQEIGYKSTDSFTKYFKQATGITPAVYIKKVSNL
ncbi:helix-turn-helix domain-containing protein [Pontimicrobium sp. MEBiC01747]